ncbi:uncharacterized protein LOC126999136 [Eriocheir sinensis]|uniref:uncharacterized protein LOC126999136 n=1 Tax=Eriocheir sinensis TaxID=95602 RepID=UPI0021C78C5E|nr:uncharacterized protein LOC126999136 [Eriocheir sinensis]
MVEEVVGVDDVRAGGDVFDLKAREVKSIGWSAVGDSNGDLVGRYSQGRSSKEPRHAAFPVRRRTSREREREKWAVAGQCCTPTPPLIAQILAVLPVSAAEAERTFSKVTRTLTEVRATMGEERLEALVMCQTHRDLLPASEKVVDFFMKSGSGTRRAQLK